MQLLAMTCNLLIGLKARDVKAWAEASRRAQAQVNVPDNMSQACKAVTRARLIPFPNLGGCLTQAPTAGCGFDTYTHALQTLSLGVT